MSQIHSCGFLLMALIGDWCGGSPVAPMEPTLSAARTGTAGVVTGEHEVYT